MTRLSRIPQNKMRRPGFEPGFWACSAIPAAWKAQVITTRPSALTTTISSSNLTFSIRGWSAPGAGAVSQRMAGNGPTPARRERSWRRHPDLPHAR